MAATQRLVLDLPSDVFAKLERAAEQKQRSVHDEAVRLLTRIVPEDDLLPPRTRAALTSLATLDDDDLWKAARKRPSTRSVGLWRALLAKRQTETLTEEDNRLLDDLEESFQRIALTRAEASLLLRDRGYDISSLGSSR
jgi:hypothetical protein